MSLRMIRFISIDEPRIWGLPTGGPQMDVKSASRIISWISMSCCLLILPGASLADSVTQLPKKQIRVLRTECLVVATEAKRLFPAYTQPDPFAREFYARISENINEVHPGGSEDPFFILDAIGVDDGRDVLGGGPAPSGVGWLPQYRDSLLPDQNQRHHYGFFFFTAAVDGGLEFVMALFGNAWVDVNDFLEGNEGDQLLADEGTRQGALARAAGTNIVWGQIRDVLCAP